ncbi:hypothetical protein [Streptomyces sp. NPDC093269]|uniref:hypothetical protein n=1 Tax=Streptomyces sp. NPDC093269 TaxID=3366038 RepID=UPI0038029076
MPGGTIDPERFDELRALHTRGLGRNAIAREMGVAPVMVSRTAEHLGLTFDRSQIQAATEARLADLAERRSLLAEDLIEDAEKLRAQLWMPAVVFAFGGKDNVYAEEPVKEPPPADKRALMATAATAIDRSLKLVPAEESNGADNERSMLDNLAAGIAALATQNAAKQSLEQPDSEA